MTAEMNTNEEKAATFYQSFFPPKPTVTDLLDDPEYPAWIKYKFRFSEAQLRQQISRLQPYKVLGEGGILNIVLKQMAELIIPVTR